MRALVQAHGLETHGTLILLLAAPCLLPVPGVSTLAGLGMAALAMAMWKGQTEPCLPPRVVELELPRHWAQRVLSTLASAYAQAGRHARARLGHLASVGRRSLVALAVGAMALLVGMPIPFGNVLPALALALALMLIGLWLVFRDGVAVVPGLLISAVAMAATVSPLLTSGA